MGVIERVCGVIGDAVIVWFWIVGEGTSGEKVIFSCNLRVYF